MKGHQGSSMRFPVSHPLSSSSLSRVSPPSQKQLNIVHFNDVYNVEARDTEPVGGAAKFVSKVKQLAKVRFQIEWGLLQSFKSERSGSRMCVVNECSCRHAFAAPESHG